MFILFQSLMLVILEMFCCKIFFEIFSVRRKTSKSKNYCLLFALILGAYIGAVFLNNFFLVKQIAIIIFISLIMFLYLKINFKKALVLSILFQGLSVMADYFIFLFRPNKLKDMYYMNFLLIVVLGKMILFFAILVIKKCIGKNAFEVLEDREWLKFLIFPSFTIVTIALMISNSTDIVDPKQSDIYFIIACGMAGLNIFVFYLINEILAREHQLYNNRIFEIQVKNQVATYQSVSENLDKQKRKIHEFKNQMMCIESLVNYNKIVELKQYVGTITDKLNSEIDIINTNHVIINAIINTKYQEAIKKNIIFIIKINDLSKIKIEDDDIVIILANLIGNAFEACEKCNNKKYVKLKFLMENHDIIISVKNTHNNININRGIINTSKSKNKEEHGFGIKNIVSVIEKYKGSYVIQSSKDEFYFSILIPQ